MVARRVNLIVKGLAKPQPRQRFRSVVPAADRLHEIFDESFKAAIDALGDGSSADIEEERWRQFRRLLVSETRTFPYPEDDAPVGQWRKLVREAWLKHGGHPFVGPVHVSMTLFLNRPASKTKKKAPNPREWDTRKSGAGGDWDNFAKAICDELNGLAYEDDSQVAVGVVMKALCNADEQPRAEIVVKEPTAIARLIVG